MEWPFWPYWPFWPFCGWPPERVLTAAGAGWELSVFEGCMLSWFMLLIAFANCWMLR